MIKRVFPVLLLLCGVTLAAQTGKPEPIPPPPDVKAPPADAVKTASGLFSKVLSPGKGGDKPTIDNFVTVHYTGWTTDGKMFDSSLTQGKAAFFPLNKVIKGWGEGVQLMTVGEKRRLWIPQELAYAGIAGRPAGMLVFDIELLGIEPSPTVPPPDVKAPPADAKKTNSGIAYKVLKAGTGTEHPARTSRVTVHYSGWTTDGKLFDSSVMTMRPATFALNEVIDGWTEGVQLMVVGEKTRFWIPERLAYKGERDPKGMLVFDIELLALPK